MGWPAIPWMGTTIDARSPATSARGGAGPCSVQGGDTSRAARKCGPGDRPFLTMEGSMILKLSTWLVAVLAGGALLTGCGSGGDPSERPPRRLCCTDADGHHNGLQNPPQRSTSQESGSDDKHGRPPTTKRAHDLHHAHDLDKSSSAQTETERESHPGEQQIVTACSNPQRRVRRGGLLSPRAQSAAREAVYGSGDQRRRGQGPAQDRREKSARNWSGTPTSPAGCAHETARSRSVRLE